MALLPFLLMSQTQAARFREETAQDENRLDPRLIEAGPYKGKYALPERVMFDPAFIDRRDAFRMLSVVGFETDEAWPPETED